MITFRANRPLQAAPVSPLTPRSVLVIGAENSLAYYLAHALRDGGTAVAVQAVSPETILAARRSFNVIEQPLADLRFAEQLQQLQPDVILYAPPEPGHGRNNWRPLEVFNRVVSRVVSVCDATRRFAPDARLLLLSSADVYGECGSPAQEEQPLMPATLTGRYYHMAEQIAQDFAATHKLKLIICRTSSVYGPAVRNNPVHDLIMNLLGPQGTDNHVPLDPHALRDLLHAGDFVEAVKLLLAQTACGVYNVGSGTTHSLEELNVQLCDLLELPRLFHRAEPQPHLPQRQWLATTRLEQLGFKPGVPLLEGLRGYIGWWSGIQAA